MITEQKHRTMDVGLPVLYDGDRNEILYYDRIISYPAGAMIAEYVRLKIKEIKQIILECSHVSDEPTDANIAMFVDDFQDRMKEHFEPVAGTMATMEIYSIIEEWIMAETDGQGEKFFSALQENISDDEIKEYIFANTGYFGVGKTTVGHMALSAYAFFAISFIHTSYMFHQIIKFGNGEKEADKRAVETLGNLYFEMISMQHIDYRIISIDGVFRSYYVIKTGISLLTFEFAHWADKGIPFVKCVNCGHYFIPDGRSDQIYCTYAAPQNKEKTCREIGAQITRANKEKSDVVTKEYRKVYMRYKMNNRRHPGNREIEKKLDALTDGMSIWRKKLSNGTATTDQFLEWLSFFD